MNAWFTCSSMFRSSPGKIEFWKASTHGLTYGSSLTSKLVKCANTAKQNILQIKHTVKLRDVLDVGNISPGTFAVPENNEFQSHQNGAVMQKMQIQLCFWRIVLVCWSLAASMVWLLKVWCDWASFRFQSCQNYKQRSQAAKDLGKFDDISQTWSLEFLYFLVKFFYNKLLKRFSLETVRHHSIIHPKPWALAGELHPGFPCISCSGTFSKVCHLSDPNALLGGTPWTWCFNDAL